MFMMSEYAACVLLVIALTALVLVVGGIVYLLKVVAEVGLRVIRTKVSLTQSVGKDPAAVADGVS